MKAFNEKHLDVEHVGDIDGHDMVIEAESMAFVFDLMFNQMYRQPVESIVREITSNCFDAHAEAGVEDAVVVGFNEDEGGKFIYFKDVGIGLSPDRMVKVYRKPASSTKRGTNNQIGYFGLGSKSPLAYDDSFMLETNADGIHYEYIVHKGDKGTPRIEKMSEVPTTERNGTTVKIYFKESLDNLRFRNAILDQLTYFDNVYVDNCPAGYDNNYKLYIGETFKYRNDSADKVLHLCIGKVKYPIDWKAINRQPINLPFGLKFDIGELPITPERESVRYIEVEKEGVKVKTVDLINNKIDAFVAELKALAGGETVEHNNIVDWYLEKDNYPTIKLLGNPISLRGVVPLRVHVYTPFAPIEHLFPVPIDFFKNVKVTRSIDRYKLKKALPPVNINPQHLSINDINKSLILREEKSLDKLRPIIVDYINHLARQKGVDTINFVKETKITGTFNKSNYPWITMFMKKRHVDVNGKTVPSPASQDLSKISKFNAYKYYRTLVKQELYMHSIDLATLEIPQDFTDKWKEEHKRATPRVKTVEDVEVAVFNIRNGNPRNGLTKSILKLHDLRKFSGFIIYGFGKDLDRLLRWTETFRKGTYSGDKACGIYQINMKDEKYFMARRNCIYVQNFMSDHKVFKKVATGAIITRSTVWNKAMFAQIGMQFQISVLGTRFDLIFSPVTKKLIELKKKAESQAHYKDSSPAEKEFVDEIISVAKENDWIEKDVEEDLTKCERYFEGVGLSKFIIFMPQSMPHIANYFHLCGKKVNPEWINPDQWVIDLLKESLAKKAYMTECKDILSSSSRSFDKRMRERYDIYNIKLSTQFIEDMKLVEILKEYHEQKA